MKKIRLFIIAVIALNFMNCGGGGSTPAKEIKQEVTAPMVAKCSSEETVKIFPKRDVTLIESSQGEKANSKGESLFVGRTNQPNDSKRRTLLYFDVAADIPANAVIVSASLKMNLTGQSLEEISKLYLYSVIGNWSEGSSGSGGAGGGSGDASALGDATWLHRSYPEVLWGVPGGDHALEPTAVAAVSNLGEQTWVSEALLSEVKAWYEKSQENFGWILVGDETQSKTAKKFTSRESSAAPYLEIRCKAL